MLVSGIPQYIQGLTNAKIDLTDTDNEVLYTAPSSADFNASVINSILVSNDSGSADTITVTLVSGSDIFSLFKLEEIGAVSTKELLLKDLILQSGEIIKVQAATGARLHVIASIQELNKTRITTSALTNI